MHGKALKAAFGYTVPVLIGYLFLGMAYGMLMHAAGYPIWLVGLCSVLIYAGSMQYASVALLGVFDPLGTFLITLMINARHLFYGVSMLEPYRAFGKKSKYMIFALTDETFSIHISAKAPDGVDQGWMLFYVSLLDHCYWVIAGILGAVLGGLLAMDTTGIDFVMTALFVTIVTDQWLENKQHLPAIIGFFAAGICRLLFGADFIVFAMLLIAILLLVARKKLEEVPK